MIDKQQLKRLAKIKWKEIKEVELNIKTQLINRAHITSDIVATILM